MNNPKKQNKPSVFDMLADVEAASNGTGAMVLAINEIAPDPDQPRKSFDNAKLENLATSIAKLGVIQPITVRESGMPEPRYFIVAGERRWRASQIAKLTEIPVFLRNDLTDDGEVRTIAQLAENMNRTDLTDYDVAKAIRVLIDNSPDPKKHGLKAEIAEYLDRPRSEISRLLKMLEGDNISLVEEGLIVSADALSRFRSCDADLQEQLVAEARQSGEPITSGTVRAARAVQKTLAEAGSRSDTESGTAASGAAGGTNASIIQPDADAGIRKGDATGAALAADGLQDDHNGGDQVATGSNASVQEENAGSSSLSDGGAATLQDGPSDTGSFGEASHTGYQDGGDDTENDDDGNGDDDDAGSNGGGFATAGRAAGEGAGGAGGSSGGSSAPRSKAVSLQVTGEAMEKLLMFLVDKSSDKMEVRLPNDLAIAVIENLSGDLPENPEHYAQTIKDLLAAKMA